MSLHAEAAAGAIQDAGLVPRDIDGLLCAYSMTEPHPMLAGYFAEYFGISPEVALSVQAGGATSCIMIAQAMALVRSGMCRNVLCVVGDNRLTGMSRDGAVQALSQFGHPQFERPYGISIPAAYGLVAQRYMHEYGATHEELAAIAVTHRRHAARHPNSHMTAPLSMEDVARSRIIASPLRLFDCCLVSDGGAAVIVSNANQAHDCAQRPVWLRGTGQAQTHEHIMAAPSLTDFGCKEAAHRAMARAGVTRGDFNLVEIYDSFTITLLIELESIGFFEIGTAGKAIVGGALELDGSLPCNTHGGLLSHGHSGAAGGMYHVIEAVQQLRRSAGLRQVKDANLAFVHGDGGILSAHCSLVLERG